MFLNGELNEDVYIDQPEGFEARETTGKIYKVNCNDLHILKKKDLLILACVSQSQSAACIHS